MKKMKKTIIPVIAIVLLLHVNKTFAQTSQNVQSATKSARPPQLSPQQRETEVATRTSKTLGSKLSLTTVQSEKVYQAYLHFAREMDQHNAGNPLTQQAHDQYVAERDAKIKNVLTSAQYNNYVTMNKFHGSVARNN
jgi:hypothetical protein